MQKPHNYSRHFGIVLYLEKQASTDSHRNIYLLVESSVLVNTRQLEMHPGVLNVLNRNGV